MKDDNEYRGGRPAGDAWRLQVVKRLVDGAEFRKYGNAGCPHQRWVYVTTDLKHVCYASEFGQASGEQMIPVRQLSRVIKGMETSIFERQITAKDKMKLQ